MHRLDVFVGKRLSLVKLHEERFITNLAQRKIIYKCIYDPIHVTHVMHTLPVYESYIHVLDRH